MAVNLTVSLTEKKTTIKAEQPELTIMIEDGKKDQATGLRLLWEKRHLVGITSGKPVEAKFDQLMTVTGDWDFEPDFLAIALHEAATENGVEAELGTEKTDKLPKNLYKPAHELTDQLAFVLGKFGYGFAAKPKKRPAKAAHRWSKAVSEIDFFADYDGSQATVRWVKRNEMVIKKGATMRKETLLNKDGSVGFGARFALTLRDENQDKFNKDFVTTEDITLQSVNEVGHFLYFAGTNSWLVLKDKDGKTIDEWTRV